MSGLSAPVSPIAPVPGHEYAAGACNIGPWEIRRRRTAAVAAFVAAAVMLVALVALGAPDWARLIVIAPVWGGLISWLQARRRFCVAYAIAGVANFGDRLEDRRTIVDPAQREADRHATVALVRDAFLLAVVPALVAVVLPV
jgi:hypothetical protein